MPRLQLLYVLVWKDYMFRVYKRVSKKIGAYIFAYGSVLELRVFHIAIQNIINIFSVLDFIYCKAPSGLFFKSRFISSLSSSMQWRITP